MTDKGARLLHKIVSNQRKRYHKNKYVYLKFESIKHKVMHNNFINIVNELLENNYTQIPVTTLRSKFKDKTFTIAHKHNTVTLVVYDNKEFKFYFSDTKDEKNKCTSNPMPRLKENFKNRTAKTLKEAFGSIPQYFKVCVPQPLYYQSPLYGNNAIITNVCKEDYSSHYPSCAVGLLPDANTSVEVKKYEKPNEEYQFAFYPETGHIAVYNEFDTHDYTNMQEIYGASVDAKRKFKPQYHGKETKTILMKASHYTLEELKDIYNIKNSTDKGTKEHDESKMDLLKFVGQFEQNNKMYYDNSPFAHLAATIKWRANVKMFKLINKVKDYNVIQICVDGIIHKGNPVGNQEHYLGNLICEESNAKMKQRGINQYIIFGKEKIKCHAGLDINIDSDDINEWKASTKVKFLDYIKTLVHVEELNDEEDN